MEAKAGGQIGSYEIKKLIGEGGMGSVYLGVDTRSGDEVAIKEIRANLVGQDEGEVLERLRREGEALRRLNHPNIVKMLDIVESDKDHAIIMEYVDGGTLREFMHKRLTITLDQILRIALELADALTRAHHLKIIHRDIKPGNILMAQDGTPRLTDFGLVRMEDDSNLTRSGTLVGTFSYLSPEALEDAPPDAKRDIWAFGVLLFEMLAGRRPFEGQSSASLVTAILTEDLPDLNALRPHLPARLVRLIESMLEKDPTRRIGSVRRVGAEIEAVIEELGEEILSQNIELRSYLGRFDGATPAPTNAETVIDENAHLRTPSASGLPDTAAAAVRTEALPSDQFKSRPGVATKIRGPRWLVGVGMAAILAILATGAFFILSGGDEESADGNTVKEVAEIFEVPPVESGEWLILVAQLEPLGAEQPTDRFLLDDLVRNIELSSSSTRARIVEYPGVVRSSDEANAIAQANQAPMIIWGNYSDNFVEMQIQLNYFDEPQIDIENLYETGNVRLRTTDVRSESISPRVLSGLAIWQLFKGDAFEGARAMLAAEDLSVTPASLVGSTVAARTYDALSRWVIDPTMSVELMDSALRQSPSNPVLYAARATSYQRNREIEQAIQDYNTALRLADDRWNMALMGLAQLHTDQGDVDLAIDVSTRAAELQPDEWLPYAVKGSYEYLIGDYAAAQESLELAVMREPRSTFPYLILTNLAVRSGDLDIVTESMNVILNEFPDPTLEFRMIEAFAGGASEDNTLGLTLLSSAFTNIALGQIDDAIADTEAALAAGIDSPVVDVYLLQGVAHCIQGNYAAAEASFSADIEAEPDLTIFYLMRADARQKQGNFAESILDIGAAQETSTWEKFLPFVEAQEETPLGCEDFFG